MQSTLISLLAGVLLMSTSCKPGAPELDPDKPSWGKQPDLPAVKGESKLILSGSDSYVNVMGNEMPRMPVFPALKTKADKLIGYVADLRGKPVEGAVIGVRSTVVGGSYSSATTETDANGYYEILVPWGAAHLWAAGCSIPYSSGKAAVSLYPADGKVQAFESTKGMVENFVLLSYGLANEAERIEKPWSSGGYFGGSLFISYRLGDPNDIWADKGSLPYNAEIELTLKPEGETLYGETRSFVISKKLENLNFTVNNLPIGRYTISARLKDGRALKIRQIGPYVSSYPHQGLKPKEALGTAQVWFTPMGVEAQSASPNRGGWRPVDIRLDLP